MRKAARRWLFLGHRWAGIALCLLFTLWFASGVVMMYVPFPSFRAAERIAASPPIAWDKVKVDPGAALGSLRLGGFPHEMRLGMTAGEPVYRFATQGGRRAVSAVTGREIFGISADQAKAIATSFVHAAAKTVTMVDHDQWVVTRSYAAIAPFWRVRLADAAATEVYVTQATGEIVQNSTAFERGWNWAGSIPHWIYFEALRSRQELWRQVLLWTAGPGVLAAVAGLWIGILRMRIRRRYRTGSATPYRGWMKWHHLAGLSGGLFLVGWIFSGWLSMSPWGGLRDDNGEVILARYERSQAGFPSLSPARMAAAGTEAREVYFTYIAGRPSAILVNADGARRRIEGVTGAPLIPNARDLVEIARTTLPDARLASIEQVTHHDSYWYAAPHLPASERPLPVFRFRFADEAGTWLHVHPGTGELLGTMGNGDRADRWLFSALHRFDLPLLLQHRSVRDGLMWILTAAGLLISVSGVVIGWRRLTARGITRKPRGIRPSLLTRPHGLRFPRPGKSTRLI